MSECLNKDRHKATFTPQAKAAHIQALKSTSRTKSDFPQTTLMCSEMGHKSHLLCDLSLNGQISLVFSQICREVVVWINNEMTTQPTRQRWTL